MNVALLKESFEMIAPRKEEFAHSFYQRLFSQYPESRQLFAQTEMKKQESSLMATLALVVTGVKRGDDLTLTLQKLGEKHRGYGAAPAHYPLVGGVLLQTFDEYLGPEFTSDMQDAWLEAYAVISEQMLIGAGQQVS